LNDLAFLNSYFTPIQSIGLLWHFKFHQAQKSQWWTSWTSNVAK